MADITREYRGLRFTLHSLDGEREQFIVERISDGVILNSAICAPTHPSALATLMDEWLAAKIGAVEPEPVHCRGCAKRLEPEMRMDTEYQFDTALWVEFDGGYGMFIDPLEDGPIRAVICHECAHELCEKIPWVDALLNPQRSHSHRSSVCESLILDGHDGWDLERSKLDGGPQLRRHLQIDHNCHDMPGTVRESWALHYRLHRDGSPGHKH
jgi:hypothetical protein